MDRHSRRLRPRGLPSRSSRSHRRVASSSSQQRLRKGHRKSSHRVYDVTPLNSKSAFFLHDVKFVTPFPKFEVAPKLYKYDLGDRPLYEFAASMLALKHRRRMHPGVTLGLDIDVVRGMPDVPREGEDVPILNAGDKILLGEGAASQRDDKKLYKTTYSWLRKTEYIASTGPSRATSGGPPVLVPKQFGPRKDVPTFDVEKSFDDVLVVPERDTGDPVTLVGSYDLVPDFALWQNQYVQVAFDRGTAPEEGRGCLLIEHGDRELLHYEGDEDISTNPLYRFRKKFSMNRYNENLFVLTVDAFEKKASYCELPQLMILKKNPYRTQKGEHRSQRVVYRPPNSSEYAEITRRMKTLGMMEGNEEPTTGGGGETKMDVD